MSAKPTEARRDAVLVYLRRYPGATVVQVRDETGVHEEAARTLMRQMHASGVLDVRKVGATKHFWVAGGAA